MRDCIGIIILVFIFTLVLAGCSGGADAPVMPENNSKMPETSGAGSERMLWGVWGFEFDAESGEIVAVPKRDLAVHYDITQMLISPACPFCFSMTMLEYKPLEKYVKIRIGLWNKTQFTGYDVRGIVVSNAEGLKLRDADGYIKTWDDGGPIEINPFLAFAKNQPKHEFAPEAMFIKEFVLDYDTPEDLSDVTLVIDASYPGNCREPYKIKKQYSSAIPEEGGVAEVKLKVLDWQNNTENVTIDMTPLGGDITHLEGYTGNTWHAEIMTFQHNEPGDYLLKVTALSYYSQWSLYDYVQITVEESPCEPDGDDTWEVAQALPFDAQASDWVCEDDISDWYMFDVEIHAAGEIRLNITNSSGPAILEFYDDPETDPLAESVATPPEDAVIDLTTQDLGAGTYFIRVGYTGTELPSREYTLFNEGSDVICFPDGNNSYSSAYEISALHHSGTQVVCALDPVDWFVFELDGGPHPPLEIDALTFSGGLDITLYDEFQAWDPDGPNIYAGEFNTKEVLDLNELSLPSGKYYFRVRQTFPSGNAMAYSVRLSLYAYQWVRTEWEGDSPFSMCTGDSGQVHISGMLSSEGDLDIGPSVDMHGGIGESDGFLINAEPDGSYNWGTAWGGMFTSFTYCNAVATDSSGNIYLVGGFTEIVDFDPGDGFENRESEGVDAFLLKLDPSGNFLWVQTWGGDDWTSQCTSTVIDIDSNGGVYVGGSLNGTNDFDPDPDIERLLTGLDIPFICKYDAAGNFKWAYAWHVSDGEPVGIAASPTGGVYIIGWFSQEGDFDPKPSEDWHTSMGGRDAYICRYDAVGYYLWTRTWGGEYTDRVSDITVNENDEAYVVGSFQSIVDFDPGSGVDERAAQGHPSDSTDTGSYLTRFDSSGNYLGAQTWGGFESNSRNVIALNDSEGIYISGLYRGPCDFDPGPGFDERASYSTDDFYLLRLEPDGEYDCVLTWGTLSGNRVWDIATYNSNDVFVLGEIDGFTDFDPGPDTNYVAGPCPFISKFSFAD